ncbi:MAG: hypothetical protein KDD82_20935 [Planctomycetes bacterium]|nr:hypothetical protein [Planctomycetota bacterium]
MNVELTVHDLRTDVEGTQSFASVEAAKAWLAERPKFIQVFGVATRELSQEVGSELRACMRALDDEERQLKDRLAAKADEAARQRAKVKRAEEAEHHRAELAAADPNRPLDLSYRYDSELTPTDVADAREITPEARQAVLEWIEERNTWVESRSQIVGMANVKVWPGPLPEGETERVIEGNFVPVSN